MSLQDVLFSLMYLKIKKPSIYKTSRLINCSPFPGVSGEVALLRFVVDFFAGASIHIFHKLYFLDNYWNLNFLLGCI